MRENMLWLLRDMRKAKKLGINAIKERQRDRLTGIVAFARANSPYYKELYKDMPERIESTTLMPITSKKKLMPQFNDWCTDRDVTFEKVRKFVDNPDLVGERFMGRYKVATTSGTTGQQGIFLMDNRALAVDSALTLRMLSSWLTSGDLLKLIAMGGRSAALVATGGHFISLVNAAKARKTSGIGRKGIQIFSVQMPLLELVDKLNEFRPAILAGYASMIALLASEQETGRLRINPLLVVPGAEGLPSGEYDRIASVFNAKVRNGYAATECPFISSGCEHGWLHVNSDWVILEPVDADYQPVPTGEWSHTVLVSNLANRIQPILRYDLGDSVMLRPDSCSCGNPLPAIRVQGRAADMLTFPTDHGKPITVPPLVFVALVDRVPGIDIIQIVQTTPTNLRVRLRPAAGADQNLVWQAVNTEITHLLTEHKLGHVTVERAEEPPEQSPGGKFRKIIPLS